MALFCTCHACTCPGCADCQPAGWEDYMFEKAEREYAEKAAARAARQETVR